MENESVVSGRSDRSRTSQSLSSRNNSRRQHYYNKVRANRGTTGEALLRYPIDSEQDFKDDRSVASNNNKIYRRTKHGLASEFLPERMTARDYDDQCDNATVLTAATSDFAYSLEDLNKNFGSNNNSDKSSFLHRTICNKFLSFVGICFLITLCIISFLSPVVMLLLPKLPLVDWEIDVCDPECESAFLGIGFKLLIILIATWALFLRRSRVNLPRLDPGRAVILLITFLLTFSFWLFYGVRLFKKPEVTYLGIISFVSSYIDSLIFIHYMAVVILEISHLQSRFAVKIIRSPDGHSKTYSVGKMRIQNLANWCLDKYYTDFQSFNPYLEMNSKKSSSSGAPTAFKLYNLDGLPTENVDVSGGGGGNGKTFSVVSSSVMGGGRVGHNEKYYDDLDYEKRVLRRKSRLLVAAEDAFAHVKKIRTNKGPQAGTTMSSRETAQAILPTLVRPLQKYLRITRQQPKYTMEDVIGHLSMCITYELSYKAFLERYIQQNEVVFVDSRWNQRPKEPPATNNSVKIISKNKTLPHSWVITSEGMLNRGIVDGCIFKLSRNTLGGECLFVSVTKLPFYDIMEQPFSAKSQRFTLNMNVELSV